jgi:hypothetical protein
MSISKIVFIAFIAIPLGFGCSPNPPSDNSDQEPPLFSEEIKTELDHERNLLHREMDSPVYVEVLHAANENQEILSSETIQHLDQQWALESPKDALAQALLNSACSEQLRAFRSANPEFAEIFITDNQGRNVCLTNKTSDYYQADEAWWINTNATTDPYGLYSPIEFDESSSTESISLYLPVLDPATGNKLGILKAVVTLSHLAEGL